MLWIYTYSSVGTIVSSIYPHLFSICYNLVTGAGAWWQGDSQKLGLIWLIAIKLLQPPKCILTGINWKKFENFSLGNRALFLWNPSSIFVHHLEINFMASAKILVVHLVVPTLKIHHLRSTAWLSLIGRKVAKIMISTSPANMLPKMTNPVDHF